MSLVNVRVLGCFVAAAVALASSLGLPQSANAQVNIGAGQSDLIRQLKDVEAAMRDYSTTHDHFPNCQSESDECLRMLYKRVALSDADSTVFPQSNGAYRCYFQFAIGVDPSYKSIPIVNGVPQIPASYVAPGGKIVIMTDGDDECVAWASSASGQPLVITPNSGPIYFQLKIKPKSDTAPDKPEKKDGKSSVEEN